MGRLYVTELDWWADVATVASGVITLLIALIGSGGGVAYLVNRYKFRQKSKPVEEYLRREKAKEIDRGQRTARNIRRHVEEDLTEEEIYKISRRNPKIHRLVRVDENGLAGENLYQYIGEG